VRVTSNAINVGCTREHQDAGISSMFVRFDNGAEFHMHPDNAEQTVWAILSLLGHDVPQWVTLRLLDEASAHERH
jgi:hypothetical protein